jgi:alpha-tubulin suppressor-like RCC1 family protein
MQEMGWNLRRLCLILSFGIIAATPFLLPAMFSSCTLPSGTETPEGPPDAPAEGPAIAVLLDGQAVAHCGVVDAFAGAAPGTPKVVDFSVMNIGDEALDLAATEPLKIDGPDAGLFSVDQAPGALRLAPSQSTSFSIRFSPDSPGIRTARLTVNSNDPECSEFQFAMTNIPSRGHMICGGWYHSVAVTQSGSVWSWGSNYYGQLGDGTTTDRAEPVQVPGLTGIVSVAAGGDHTLALKSDGSVWSWGDNPCGELGDGTCQRRTSPVKVAGLTSVIAVAAGAHHSVALKADGTVWTWGFDTGRTTPGMVPGLTGIAAISSGNGWFTLALRADGSVWAWGRNEHGQLGNGTTTDSTVPVQVSGLTDVRKIAAGQYVSAAVTGDGSAWVWGQPDGQYVPFQVAGLSQIAAVGGGRVPIALRCDGTVWKMTAGVTPVDGLSDIVGIAGGEDHWIALRSDGAMLAWGDDSNGQLGSGVRTYRTEAVQVSGISDVTAISAGRRHSLALDATGKVSAWGSNRFGLLGIGNCDEGPGMRGICTPQPVCGSLSAARIDGGWDISFALEPDGDFWTWGNTPFGFLDAPELPVQLSGATSAAASMRGLGTEIVMLKSDGTLWYYFTSAINGQIAGLANIVSLGGYDGHAVLDSDGFVWKWDHGVEPTQLPGISGVVSFACGGGHTVVANITGAVWAWGNNNVGQLGDGTTIDRASPVQVVGISDVVQVAAGSSHSLALKNDGTVWAWGGNSVGSLGDGTTSNRNEPIRVQGLSGITAITASGFGSHSLALDSAGNVWAWGSNSDAQIGDGVSVYQTTPALVSALRLW